MNTIFPPSKLRRLSHSSSGSGSGGLSMEMNGAHPIGLGLALGTGGESSEDKKHDQQEMQMQMHIQRRSRSYGFTMQQMQELKHQTIIYKYIEAECDVPHSILLPLWRSVSSTFGNINIIPDCKSSSRKD
ncbi:Growth-regulating factor 6 [Euphorbia peplus]|nr:Growth-regulating factor 6 [Euphorbia peplus]